MEKLLPAIPAKRYFTIGEVSELCGVKPYVLRYWEQEFTQLKPMKRRGNRRYYQHHEVLLIRRIRELLYDQGFTISGARNRLGEPAGRGGDESRGLLTGLDSDMLLPPRDPADPDDVADLADLASDTTDGDRHALPEPEVLELGPNQLRAELLSIRALLAG